MNQTADLTHCSKPQNTRDKKKVLRATSDKRQITYKGKKTRMMSYFPSVTLDAWNKHAVYSESTGEF